MSSSIRRPELVGHLGAGADVSDKGKCTENRCLAHRLGCLQREGGGGAQVPEVVARITAHVCAHGGGLKINNLSVWPHALAISDSVELRPPAERAEASGAHKLKCGDMINSRHMPFRVWAPPYPETSVSDKIGGIFWMGRLWNVTTLAAQTSRMLSDEPCNALDASTAQDCSRLLKTHPKRPATNTSTDCPKSLAKPSCA